MTLTPPACPPLDAAPGDPLAEELTLWLEWQAAHAHAADLKARGYRAAAALWEAEADRLNAERLALAPR